VCAVRIFATSTKRSTASRRRRAAESSIQIDGRNLPSEVSRFTGVQDFFAHMQALVEQKDKLLQPDPCSLLSVLSV
jgi:hypothetical protein